MPTGGGKSLCYQVPALCRPGTAIVVSPLIALMDDQVAALRQLGVKAGALHSEVEPEDAWATSAALEAGTLDLLYLSPERLLMPATQERLQRLPISLVAIDEAHCVSAWGHEFRPEYRVLARVAQHFPGVPRIALTATADPRTRTDILQALDMQDARVFAASFYRPNLNIAARAKDSETAELLTLLQGRTAEAGIVYCGSRSKTERIAGRLQARGIEAAAFHAGLPPIEKRLALTRFRAGESMVMVATIAFGMGIDRPDVRFVAHLDMPDSPESFYQQIGRAGRDGEPSDTLLLYGGEDIARARHWQAQSTAPEAQKRISRERLEAMVQLTETTGCRTRALLRCFGEELGHDCGHCDNCRRPVATFDGTVAVQKALSAVYRTGQRFGALHLVSVLRGEETDAVKRWGHAELPTFGVGRDKPAGFWRGVIRQLLARGALQAHADHGGLEMVPDLARPLLRGEQKVMLRDDPEPPSRPRRAAAPASRTATSSGAAPGAADDDPLFVALKAWRTAEARLQGVPPYVIFHDSVLRELAAARPGTLTALGGMRGFGASKLQRYGPAILRILTAPP